MKKKLPLHGLRLRLLPPDDATATDLLLLADPSQEQIEKYIQGSHILAALMEGTVVAVCVLSAGGNNNAEIMNLAVGPDHQGRGAGRWLLNKVSEYAANQKLKTLNIATGNSSIGQLYLYQSVGFEITAIEITIL